MALRALQNSSNVSTTATESGQGNIPLRWLTHSPNDSVERVFAALFECFGDGLDSLFTRSIL